MDKKERQRILQSCHRDQTSRHMGSKRMLARITERFIWPGVTKDVYSLVSDLICIRQKATYSTVCSSLPPDSKNLRF